MKKNIHILSLVFLFSLQNLVAQQTQIQSLKDCIQYSLNNNILANISANQISIAQQQNKEGLSGYLPQVNLISTLDDNIKRQVTIIPAGALGPNPTKIQFGNQYASSITGQLDQVIYDQTLMNSIKASKLNVGLSELKMQKTEDEIIYTTASAYYQTLIFQEQLKLIADNEYKLEQLVKVQKLQYEKGVINETSYKRVLVNYNNTKSQRELAEMNVQLSIDNLKNAMGMNLNDQLVIKESLDFLKDVPAPFSENFSITDKADYKILEQNILLQEIDVKRKKAQYLPTLNGYARYGVNAFSNDFKTTYNQLYDYSAIGLKLTIPVFSGFRRVSQIKQSELTLENTKQNLSLNAKAFELQLKNAQVQLKSNYIQLQSNKENLALANEVFTMSSLQYETGTIGLSDFLNAEFSKKEAQSNYINSLLKYVKAKIELEQSKGTIKNFVNNL